MNILVEMKSGTRKVRQHHGLFFGCEQGDPTQQHQGADGQDDGADTQVGDKIALDDADRRGHSQRDQHGVRRAKAIGEANGNDRRKCCVRPDGQVNLSGDDA